MNFLSLALLLLGAVAIVYGCWLVVPAAGFVVGGVFAITVGFLLLSDGVKSEQQQ